MRYLGKVYPFINGGEVDKMIVLQTPAGPKKIALGIARMRFMFIFCTSGGANYFAPFKNLLQFFQPFLKRLNFGFGVALLFALKLNNICRGIIYKSLIA